MATELLSDVTTPFNGILASTSVISLLLGAFDIRKLAYSARLI